MSKELRQATHKEIADWPGVTVTEEDGGKHDKAVLHFNGQSRVVIMARTPSDNRALPNHLAVVRRELRALGANRAYVVMGKPKDQPANPVLHSVPTFKEIPMAREAKLDAIFKGIGELRYAEMLELAAFMRDVATENNMRRGDPYSWARTLQTAVDCYHTPATKPLAGQVRS